MLQRIIKENWFTTLIGVCLVLGAVGNAGACLISGGDFMSCIQSQGGQIMAGIGLIFSKDIVPGLGSQPSTTKGTSPQNEG